MSHGFGVVVFRFGLLELLGAWMYKVSTRVSTVSTRFSCQFARVSIKALLVVVSCSNRPGHPVDDTVGVLVAAAAVVVVVLVVAAVCNAVILACSRVMFLSR